LAYQKGIEAHELGLAITKAQRLPRLNAFGTFNINDESPVGFGGNNFMVGLSLSWKLHLGQQLRSKTAAQGMAIEKAQIELDDQKAQANMALQQATAQYRALQEQLKQADANISLATEQARILQNRLREGLERSADLLTANVQLAEVKLKQKGLFAKLKQTQNQIEFLLTE